jgi:hypothetical protein
MTTANNIHSFSNFTLSGGYTHKPYPFFSQSQTSKNYSLSNLDFTITVPTHIALEMIENFNRSAPSPEIKKIYPTERGIKTDTSEKGLLSPLVLSGADVVSYFSNHIRQGFSSYHQVHGTENPTALTALGFTTGFSLVSGGVNIKNGIKEFKTAEKTSDIAGKKLSLIKIAKGSAQIAAGSTSFPARILTIASLITASKAFSTVANVFGDIGASCFKVVSIIGAIGISIRLHEQRLFRNQLDLILNDPNSTEQERSIKALEHLKRLASISPQEKEEIRKEIALQPEFSSLNPQQLTEKVEERANTLLMKKEAYLKRLIDGECLDQIRQKGPAEANSVIEAVQKKSKEKIILSSLGMSLIVVGLATSFISFMLTGPVGIILIAGLGLATSLGWVLLDSYEFYHEFKSTDPGRFDKLWIFISTVIAITSVSLVFFLSGGIAPIIAALVVQAVWLGINFICYYRIYQLEKKNNPHLIQA